MYDLATASAISLPVKSPVVPAVFRIPLFEAVLNASVATLVAPGFLVLSRSFWVYLLLKFSLVVLGIFLAKDKNP